MDLGIFGTQTCHLACEVASLWRPGGPRDDLGTLGTMTKDTSRSRLGFLMIFGRFRDPIWKTMHLAREVLQKSTFAEVVLLMIPGSIFYDFECP